MKDLTKIDGITKVKCKKCKSKGCGKCDGGKFYKVTELGAKNLLTMINNLITD